LAGRHYIAGKTKRLLVLLARMSSAADTHRVSAVHPHRSPLLGQAGGQWTGHYSTERHDELSVAFFGFDLSTHRANLMWKGSSACSYKSARSETAQRSYNQTMLLHKTLLSRKQLQSKQFYCKVHADDTATAAVKRLPAYLIPRNIRDANTHVVHTYVCNVTSAITKSELLKLQSNNNNGSVRVSLEMQHVTADKPDQSLTASAATSIRTVADVDLPISGGIGYSALMMNSSTTSVLTLRAPIVLCAFGGYNAALKHVREWVVHNIQIGIGVIFLGTIESEFSALQRELKYFIDKGQVVLLAAQEMCFIQQRLKVPKVLFYQVSCYVIQTLWNVLVL
jgi:hypothetical protein